MTIIPLPIPAEVTKAVLEEALSLLKTFLGPASKEFGEIGGDCVRFFHFERQVNCLRKAHKIVQNAGISPKAVNMRVLFPLLDAAGFEDDETMSERWASLLASAANPNNQTSLEASFIEILKQLAPTHAYLLDVFYEQIKRDEVPAAKWSERGYSLSTLKAYLKQEVPDFDVAIENLFRLNLVAHPKAKLGIANGQEVSVHVTSSNLLCATNLGYAFVFACGHGRTPRNISYGVPGDSIENVFWTRGGSVNLSPAPPAKAIPLGEISPELKLKVEFEALAIAQKIGAEKPGVVLFGRILRVHLGKMPSCKNEIKFIQAIFPLTEFCAERDLKLETHRDL